jgi:hypothetical protein
MMHGKQTDLENAIEQLVREHLAALHKAAAAAVERGFSQGKRSRMRAGPTARRPSVNRRPPDEVAALAERLYAAVCANPGAGMPKLASVLGTSPRALNRPAIQLRRAGRLRSVGQRQATRYFPMTGKASAKL